MPQGQYKLTDAKPIGQFSLADAAPVDANAPPQAGGFSHAAEEFWKRANPMSWAEGLLETAKHPVDAAMNIVRADPQFLAQAKDSAAKGDYLTATRKLLSYMSMGFGHDLDAQAEMGAKGDLPGMLGAMGGTATQFLAPEAAGAVVPKVAGAVRGMKPANPAIADAVGFGKAAGVPLDAATATDNAAVRAVQHLSDKSLGGAQIAGKAAQRQAEGLATLGEQLAAKAYPKPVTPELAGQGVRSALEQKIGQHAAAANTEYGNLRAIADQNRETVVRYAPTPAAEDAAVAFTYKPNALPDEVFEHVYADAKDNGYTGAKGDLRRKFDEHLKSGYDGLAESDAGAAELAPETLLKDIKQYGGLKPFDKESGTKFRGEYQSIQQGFNSHTSGWHQRGGAQIFRNDGLSLDGMLEALQQDPKWAGKFESTNDLLNELNDIARGGPTAKLARGTVEDALRLTDVRPGAKWWVKRVEEDQALPVNLANVRQHLAPIYDRLQQERDVNGLMLGQKGTALNALTTLMKAGDFAPLEVVDQALSDLKAMARGKDGSLPELRSDGQGVAAAAVRALDAEVRKTAAMAGPEAMRALDAGRAATKAKYAVARVYDAIKDEPVRAFSQAVSPNDSAIGALRDVAKHAPDELPKIGRAYLDSLLEKATADGGFAKADKLSADWQRLGPETKRLLFKDPAHVRDLDRFFLLAKQAAKNANPSGTAHAAAIAVQGGSLVRAIVTGNLQELGIVGASVAGTAGLSAFLHSPAGVKLLTEGLTLPKAATKARAAWQTRLQKFAVTNGLVQASQPAGAGPQG